MEIYTNNNEGMIKVIMGIDYCKQRHVIWRIWEAEPNARNMANPEIPERIESGKVIEPNGFFLACHDDTR